MPPIVDCFDIHRQRRALLALADSTDFLLTHEGSAFLEQLRCIFAPRAVAEVQRLGVGGGWFVADEAVNTIVVALTVDGGRVARYAASAQGAPWAYLGKCVTAWSREILGSRCSPLDEKLTSPCNGGDVEAALTPLEQVSALTFATLAPHTPPHLHAATEQLIQWLATNPPQRLSYERIEREHAARAFPDLSSQDIAAIMNISWGGRPRRRQTSMFAAFLLDAKFRVSDSPTHARALLHFRQLMRRGHALNTTVRSIARPSSLQTVSAVSQVAHLRAA